MAKRDIAKEMQEAQSKLKSDTPKKKKRKTVKEQYEEIKSTLKPEVSKESFSDKYEEILKQKLFERELLSLESEEESEYYQDADKNTGPVKRDGLWDYIIGDEINFFDPTCSYELTGYRPISETEGLDFDPAPFSETGRIFNETGHYTEYPKGSKPYADFWTEQLKRCSEGYIVNNYRITGDHYFFLNFYRMSIVDDNAKAASGDFESFPLFAVEQYKWFHYIEMCEHLKKDIIGLKSRGVKTCPLI